MNRIYKDRFKDKVIIVTGATSGIGKETAMQAAMEGAKVVLAGRRKALGEEIVSEIKMRGGEASFVQVDLSKEESAKELIDKTVDIYGRIDIAINNAGIMGNPCPIHKLSKEEMENVLNTNFYSVAFCCKYEIEQFIKQNTGGIIINNASTAGLTGIPGLPAYNASKHAVNGLTKNLAIDYSSKYNIRINSVNPAATDTPIYQNSKALFCEQMAKAKENGVDLSQMESFVGEKRESLLKRPSESYEQVAAILFLASEDASHMTGTTMAVDGGWTAF